MLLDPFDRLPRVRASPMGTDELTIPKEGFSNGLEIKVGGSSTVMVGHIASNSLPVASS